MVRNVKNMVTQKSNRRDITEKCLLHFSQINLLTENKRKKIKIQSWTDSRRDLKRKEVNDSIKIKTNYVKV